MIFTKTKEKHWKILEQVLNKLLEFEVRINFDKSKICVKEIQVLGYMVNIDGIHSTVSNRTNEILIRQIKTKIDVKRLVGLLN